LNYITQFINLPCLSLGRDESLNSEFLSAIAQISATIMGFSLAIPVFQAISTGHTFPAEKYIRRKNFLVKWICLVCLPLFVLSYPLIFSLVQLTGLTIWMLDGKEIYLIVSTLWDIAILCYYLVVRRFSKLMGWKDLKEEREERKKLEQEKQKNRRKDRRTIISRRIVEDVPVILLGFCLLIWFSDLTSFSLYKPDIILILLVITGFSLIVRNSGIKIDDGIVFKKSDISPKFEQGKDNFEKNIDEARAKRKEVIEKMQSCLEQYKEDKELRRSIGRHEGEIQNLVNLKSKIEEYYKGIINKISDGVTFEDFSEYDDRRKEGERHVEEFKNGTVMALKILERELEKRA